MNNGIPECEEEPIDYRDLIDKSIDCGVIINPRDLYRSTGMPLPQFFVRSCMVLNITDSGDVEHSKSEMVRSFLAKNPEALNTLAEQIAKMRAGGSSPTLLTTETPTSEIVYQSPNTGSPTSPMNQLTGNLSALPLPQIQTSTPQYQLPINNIPQGGLDLTSFMNQQTGVTLTKL